MSGSGEIEDRHTAMDVEEQLEDGQGGAGLEDEAKAQGEKQQLLKKEWGAVRNKEAERWGTVRNNEAKEASKGNEAKETSKGKEWGLVRWMEQCSKHLSHLEVRMMESEFLGHEVVRQIGNLLLTFPPPPGGGLGVAPEAGFGHRGEDDAAACEVLPEGW